MDDFIFLIVITRCEFFFVCFFVGTRIFDMKFHDPFTMLELEKAWKAATPKW